jgi:integrase
VEAFNCVAAGWGLTGGREGEVLGLELDDLSFERGVVTFRPNEWRRLKTRGSHRPVPLWPQLAEVLRPYADRRVVERGGTLLFPCWTGGMVTDWRKTRDRVAERAGWKAGEIRSKRFRHTYCAPRLQTLDHGAPVSVYTVRAASWATARRRWSRRFTATWEASGTGVRWLSTAPNSTPLFWGAALRR